MDSRGRDGHAARRRSGSRTRPPKRSRSRSGSRSRVRSRSPRRRAEDRPRPDKLPRRDTARRGRGARRISEGVAPDAREGRVKRDEGQPPSNGVASISTPPKAEPAEPAFPRGAGLTAQDAIAISDSEPDELATVSVRAQVDAMHIDDGPSGRVLDESPPYHRGRTARSFKSSPAAQAPLPRVVPHHTDPGSTNAAHVPLHPQPQPVFRAYGEPSVYTVDLRPPLPLPPRPLALYVYDRPATYAVGLHAPMSAPRVVQADAAASMNTDQVRFLPAPGGPDSPSPSLYADDLPDEDTPPGLIHLGPAHRSPPRAPAPLSPRPMPVRPARLSSSGKGAILAPPHATADESGPMHIDEVQILQSPDDPAARSPSLYAAALPDEDAPPDPDPRSPHANGAGPAPSSSRTSAAARPVSAARTPSRRSPPAARRRGSAPRYYDGLRLPSSGAESGSEVPSSDDERPARGPVDRGSSPALGLAAPPLDWATLPDSDSDTAAVPAPRLPRRRRPVPRPQEEQAAPTCTHGARVTLPGKSWARGRRLLRAPRGGPAVALAMRGDAHFVDVPRAALLPRFSLPQHADDEPSRRVEDACFVGDTLVVGYGDARPRAPQVSLIRVGALAALDDPDGRFALRTDLAHRGHSRLMVATPTEKLNRGVASLLPAPGAGADVRFFSGGHDRRVLLWRVRADGGGASSADVGRAEHRARVGALACADGGARLFSAAARWLRTTWLGGGRAREETVEVPAPVAHMHRYEGAHPALGAQGNANLSSTLALEVEHVHTQLLLYDIREDLRRRPRIECGFRPLKESQAPGFKSFCKGDVQDCFWVRGYADGSVRTFDFRKPTVPVVTHFMDDLPVHATFASRTTIMAYGLRGTIVALWDRDTASCT